MANSTVNFAQFETTAGPSTAHPVALTSKSAAAQTKPAATAPQDTVSITSQAQGPYQEARETHSQTLKEARSGDMQAQRLLAKEEAAKNPVK